jgi:hypothetical protein
MLVLNTTMLSLEEVRNKYNYLKSSKELTYVGNGRLWRGTRVLGMPPLKVWRDCEPYIGWVQE